MSKEITKNLMCILMRSGVEIWAENDKIDHLKKILMEVKESKFIILNNEMINTSDIVGVFDAATMEDRSHRKNGEWVCSHGFWHKRFEQCGHRASDKS